MNVIHIVENLDKGAVENWLVKVFIESRRLRPSWRWTFYCILGKPGRLDEMVRQSGGNIIYTPVSLSSKLSFIRHLKRTLKLGNFDLIHAHHDYLSGFYMLASFRIPGRKIIHLHNNDEVIPVGSKILRKLLLPVFRKLALYLSDDIIAISENTRDEFKKGFTGLKPHFHILYVGISMDNFRKPVNRLLFRRENALPDGCKILLFAGRMIVEKNPVFVVDVLDKLLLVRKDVYAVFVGKGDQGDLVTKKAEILGIEDHIRIIGWSDNIPAIMKSSDAFIFPHLEKPKEGLGLVVIEAQCAGLPIFISKGVVPDAVILKKMSECISLEEVDEWAKKINHTLSRPVIAQEECLEIMLQSAFSLDRATENLIHIYERNLV